MTYEWCYKYKKIHLPKRCRPAHRGCLMIGTVADPTKIFTATKPVILLSARLKKGIHMQKLHKSEGDINISPRRDGWQKENINASSSQIELVAKEQIEISDQVGEKIQKLFELLDEHSDVTEYFTNLK